MPAYYESSFQFLKYIHGPAALTNGQAKFLFLLLCFMLLLSFSVQRLLW